MYSVVTAKVKLPSRKILHQTMEVYSRAVQHCVDTAWSKHIKNRVELHKECYYFLRDLFKLHSQLACNAIKQAVEMVKKARSKPSVKEYLTIRYNFPRCASVSGDWETLSLSTIEGRLRLPIEIPECYRQYLDWELRESNLIRDKKGRLFFCFVFAKEVEAPGSICNHGEAVGVDLGVNTLAVTSTNQFYGGDIKHRRTRHERLVAELQSKGTPAAKRALKRFSGKWKQFQTWVNHNISKNIIDKMEEGDTLVMEDLKGIRKSARYNKWVHKWAFRQLQKFLEYKAIKKRIRVVYVDPRNTSKECNRCHSTNTSRHGGFLECRACGHTLNADLNGARNIAQRYTRITGLGRCKPAPDLTCDEAEAKNGTEVEHSQKPRPLGRGSLLACAT
ncbi:MAG: RNA-guided endonuclease InsQ/TnpB family protein [Candidatus Bathyarchaeia archaeon]